MSASWNQNRLTAHLGIQYPLIQGPLGGLATQRLTAAVSNFGGLGSFGAHGLSPEAIQRVIDEIRALTSKPFAINLWVSMEDPEAGASGEAEFQRSLTALKPYFEEVGVPLPAYQPYSAIRFEDQARELLDAKVPVFSFIAGIPPKEILDECRKQRIVMIGTATTPDEGSALQDAGVDAIVASGFEAGGHRGSFLRRAEDSLMGTLALVPQVVDRVNVPVIAAGGIADSRGVIAAFALGAEGVQMGTAFLSSEESGSHPLHRETLLQKKASHTAMTKGYTGRLARGVENRVMEALKSPKLEVLPYPLQRALVRKLTAAAEAAGRPDLMQMWAGQSASLSASPNATAFLEKIVEEIQDIAGSVLDWSAERRRVTS